MSHTLKAAKLKCQLRLEKMNAHMNPEKAKREIKRLEWELEKIPLVTLNHDLAEKTRELWESQYASKVVQLTDGYVDLEDLPPILEGGGYDGVPVSSVQDVAPEDSKAIEDAINEAI